MTPATLAGMIQMRYRTMYPQKRSGLTVAVVLAILAVARIALAA